MRFKSQNELQFIDQKFKIMENQVAQLKQKVKDLQKQLCDRTRNYLYHFKKSPIKKCSRTTESSTQTEIVNSPSQHSTQTNNKQNCFSNIHLNQTDACSFQINQQIKTDKKQEKTESVFQTYQNNTDSLNDLSTNQKVNFNQTQKNPIHNNEIDSLVLQIQRLKQQLQNTNTSKTISQTKLQYFPNITYCKTPTKEYQNSQFSKKKEIQTIEDFSQSKFSVDHSIIQIQHQNLEKEIKILKKEIRKLKAHLECQLILSTQTKHALLVSEEQNYKFRLQVQRLNKEIQILTGAFTDFDTDKSIKPFNFEDDESGLKSVDSDQSESTKEQLQKYKNQSEKYEEHILILEGVKRDYLKKCIEAKEQIYKLKQQNLSIKQQINHLTILLEKKQNVNISLVTHDSKNQTLPRMYKNLEQKWEQLFKSKIHEISNCLPIADNQEMFLFKPDSIEDLISMLERILQFCKNVEIWQRQKIQSIQRQRANLLKILSSLLVKHPDTKNTIANEILEIQQLKYLVNFMNKEPKNISNSRLFLNFENIEAEHSQSEVIETN